LAAAIVLARAGRSVLVIEAQEQIGGATRSKSLTLLGFLHDVCSGVHPMAAGSPFFRTLPLHDHGLEWIHPPCPLAHPMDDGSAVLLEQSIERMYKSLGADAPAYRNLVGFVVTNWDTLQNSLLGPIDFPTRPLAMARFGLHGMQPSSRLAIAHFKSESTRALFAGLAAHSVMPLESWGTSAIALALATLAHLTGWPIAKGGSQRIADALAYYLR